MGIKMSTNFKIISLILVIADLAFCSIVGMRSKAKIKDTEDYFIAGKNTGVILLILTTWASTTGSGNFIGQAGRGSLYGLAAYWQWLGEGVLAGIIISLLMGPFLAKYRYLSMPHFISYEICGGDPVVRRVAGFATLMPNLAWPGAQIMGVGYVLQQVFNIDFKIAVLICGAVFIFYTINGGLEAVLITDAVHGTLQIIFGSSVIIFGLKAMNFDLAFLKESIKMVDATKWDMFSMTNLQIATAFLTGFLGAVSNPIFWSRAFSAKDPSTCRKSYIIANSFNIILVFFMIILGLTSFSFNPEVGDQALVWLILNKMPSYVGILLTIGMLASTMSTADSHLNCGAANIVVDIIDPNEKLTVEKSIKYSKIATLAGGIIAIISAIYAPFIYRLGNFGYAICGGVLMPIFAIGYLMKDKKSETFKSKLTILGARMGLILGVVVGLIFEIVPSLFEIFGGGVIPAIVATTVGIFAGNYISNMNLEKAVKANGACH